MQTVKKIEMLKLPAEDKVIKELTLIDFYNESKQQIIEFEEESYKIIGDDSAYKLAINPETKEVWAIDEESKTKFFVNSNIEYFLTFLENYKSVMINSITDEEKLKGLKNLWQEIKNTDSKAVANIDVTVRDSSNIDSTWWGGFLDDKLLMFGDVIE